MQRLDCDREIVESVFAELLSIIVMESNDNEEEPEEKHLIIKSSWSSKPSPATKTVIFTSKRNTAIKKGEAKAISPRK
ncbi:MAG TPA: hypothetical protein DDW56_04305 [Cyanobacteria bacterium UBA11366]|nr:hypothetical protein [Cyanobacteria bacterium UBA11366]HCA94634.1 hypothetical protein [Cyanobacteria bacterium UBA9226]